MDKKLKEAEKKIRNLLAKKPEILAGYFFGSQTKDYARPGSDLDVAILTNSDFKPDDYRYQVKLAEELQGELESFDIKVDVSLIDDLPPALQHTAVFEGRLVYSRDAILRADEEIRILRIYEDLKRFYDQRLENNVLKAKLRLASQL